MHDLRRTYVSLVLAAGGGVPYAMEQAGHTDPKVTLSIYAQVLERSPEVGQRVDALVRGNDVRTATDADTSNGHQRAPSGVRR
jgi:integrase